MFGTSRRSWQAWLELDGRAGANDLKEIFPNSGKVFDHPKPRTFVQEIVSFVSDPDSIVLDSFAGSGTTAHAVLALNCEDGGSRRFVLVECEDYADSITAERVRRVIKGVPSAKDANLKSGLGGSFQLLRGRCPDAAGVACSPAEICRIMKRWRATCSSRLPATSSTRARWTVGADSSEEASGARCT